MPELPEVETIVRGLRKHIVGRKIISVWLDTPKLIKQPTLQVFKKEIKGLKIEGIDRRAKNILINLSQGKILLVHQKMTGHLLYGKWEIKKGEAQSLIKGSLEEKDNKYIHLILDLDNGYQIALSDLRKFAKVVLNSQEEIKKNDLKDLGPEPLPKNFDFKKFKEIILNKKGKIKQVLLDPKVISGIGNIYGDEILWEAKVNPLVSANSLTDSQLKRIFKAMKEILREAVKRGGSSVGDYRNSQGKKGTYQKLHKVYKREGEECFRCKNKISRQKIGGRSSHFCSVCQKD